MSDLVDRTSVVTLARVLVVIMMTDSRKVFNVMLLRWKISDVRQEIFSLTFSPRVLLETYMYMYICRYIYLYILFIYIYTYIFFSFSFS